MAWVLLVALVWVTPGSALRYAEYSGVKMPQYGSNDYDAAQDIGNAAVAAEDYHGHSPDASSSLDYKYEEDNQGKSEKSVIEPDDSANWNNPAKNRKKLLRPSGENNLETNDKYEPDAEIDLNLKPNNRFLKHRSRFKGNIHRNDERSARRSIKKARAKKYNSDIENKPDFYADDDEIGVKRDELEDASERVRQREITERVIRRKPRDRLLNRMQPELRRGFDDVDDKRRVAGNRRMNVDYMPENGGRVGRRRPYRPTVEDENGPDLSETDNQKDKTYEDYGDYYDMERVHDIKNKLPMLLRRPTARTDTPAATSADVIDELWKYRRIDPATVTRTTADTATSSVNPVISSEASSPTTLPSSPSTTDTTSTQAATSTETSTNEIKELSLAEKSRISILKKAQRKEGINKDVSTKKPPVLMQVTNRMLTVVVVEPPTSAMPWMRASVVPYDTPERLGRAKALMRHKIVARARNIQELTDNWDEMICDYIDVSLLDSTVSVRPDYVVLMEICFIVIIHWLYAI